MEPAEYLKAADPILGAVIEKVMLKPFRSNRNYFEALVVEIINQQLSGKVADVIEARFRSLWDGRARIGFPEPEVVLALPDAKLRSVGISFSKVSYIKNVARAAEEGKLEPANLRKLPDEEIIATLTTVKGIGRWTAKMFLMFTMGRPGSYLTLSTGLCYHLLVVGCIIQLTSMFRRIQFIGSDLLRKFGINLDDGKSPVVFKMHSTITQLGGIDFKIEFYPDGSWTAESTNIDGIITGGQDTRNINSVLKDAIFTYFEIPFHLCNDNLLQAPNEPVTIEQRVWATR